MRFFQAAVFTTLLSLAAPGAFAQRAPVGGVLEYTGSISYVTNGQHSTTVGVITSTFTVQQSAHLRVHLTWDAGLRRYSGYVIEGTGLIKETYVTTSPTSRHERGTSGESKDMSKTTEGRRRPFNIDVRNDGQYQPDFFDNDILARFYSQNVFDRVQPMRLFLVKAGAERNLWHAPLAGNVLKGSGRFQHGSPHPQPDGTVIYTQVEWEFRPGAGEKTDDEVVVTSSTYDVFRPEAGKGGGRGNDITFNARLQKAGGGEPSEKAIKFEWKFRDVSREPGYAMNMPVQDPGKDADLRFEPSAELDLKDPEGQSAESTPGERVESNATVASHDWGGFGIIEVTAVLKNGKRIQGILAGSDSGTDILVPKRKRDDYIAEAWRIAKGMTGVSAGADYENAPVGDGNAGDGLTLYQEYRGFIENGVHIEGDPRRKDFMIYNAAGSGYLPGIQKFAQLSELAAHWRFQPDEWHETNCVNLNSGRGPHAVAQHGAKILPSASDENYAVAVGHTGANRIVYIPSLTGTEPQELFDYMNSSLVHEILHTVNVYHHGDKVEPRVRWTNDGDSIDVLEVRLHKDGHDLHEPRPVRVLRESGEPVPKRLPAGGLVLTLGVQQGQHSGNDNCVMRYDSAGAYVSLADPDVRYRPNGEPAGTMLCRAPHGTGVNAAGRQPQSRYGDADSRRGGCFYQILVNDAVNPPVR